MLKQLREWKKDKGKASPAQPASKSAADAPRGFAPAPAAKAPPAPAPPPPAPRPVTANDAISELLRRGEKDADPSSMTPQQLIMVFFSFFAGWRQRNGIPGQVELTDKQKQIVILMIQSTLTTVSAARDFWPMLCAELGAGRDPEVRDLVFTLTGLRQ